MEDVSNVSAKKSRYLRAGSKDEVSDSELWEELHYPRDHPHLAEMRGCLRARRAQLEEQWDEALKQDQIRLIDTFGF